MSDKQEYFVENIKIIIINKTKKIYFTIQKELHNI